VSTEQILLAGYAPMAAVVGLLFRLLLSERQSRLEFVEKKLDEQTKERTATQEMHQTLIAVMKAQSQGALPPGR